MVPIDVGGPAVFHCLTMSRRASMRDTPRARAFCADWTSRSVSTITLSGSSVFMPQSVDPPRGDGQEIDGNGTPQQSDARPRSFAFGTQYAPRTLRTSSGGQLRGLLIGRVLFRDRAKIDRLFGRVQPLSHSASRNSGELRGRR